MVLLPLFQIFPRAHTIWTSFHCSFTRPEHKQWWLVQERAQLCQKQTFYLLHLNYVINLCHMIPERSALSSTSLKVCTIQIWRVNRFVMNFVQMKSTEYFHVDHWNPFVLLPWHFWAETKIYPLSHECLLLIRCTREFLQHKHLLAISVQCNNRLVQFEHVFGPSEISPFLGMNLQHADTTILKRWAKVQCTRFSRSKNQFFYHSIWFRSCFVDCFAIYLCQNDRNVIHTALEWSKWSNLRKILFVY